jgi:hypothetical protein
MHKQFKYTIVQLIANESAIASSAETHSLVEFAATDSLSLAQSIVDAATEATKILGLVIIKNH